MNYRIDEKNGKWYVFNLRSETYWSKTYTSYTAAGNAIAGALGSYMTKDWDYQKLLKDYEDVNKLSKWSREYPYKNDDEDDDN